MEIIATGRGFACVIHTVYVSSPPEKTRLIQESSAIGDYDDSFDKPGSSYLWIGRDHHLNREEIRELIGLMTGWLKSGHISEPAKGSADE